MAINLRKENGINGVKDFISDVDLGNIYNNQISTDFGCSWYLW